MLFMYFIPSRPGLVFGPVDADSERDARAKVRAKLGYKRLPNGAAFWCVSPVY